MAFLDVSNKKLAFLLANGTHEDELKRFFRESRTQLIFKGARMQNLPQGKPERIKAICERLPKKTDDTLRDWFQKHITLSDPMPQEDVYTYLELYFEQNEDIQAADTRLIARSALIYLFDNEPNQELLSFLRRPPGSPLTSNEASTFKPEQNFAEPEELFTSSQEGSPQKPAQPQTYQLSELLAAIITNDENGIDNALSAFPLETRSLVEALLYIRAGDVGAASKQLENLDPNSPEAEHIITALGRIRHQRENLKTYSGIQLRSPRRLNALPEMGSYDIVGIYTNESEAGAIFARPLALKLDEELYLLNRDDRIALFPESGDVMTHRSEIRHQPKRRDLLHWRVSERGNAAGKTHFRLDSELDPIYEIYPISVPSSAPDEIRERIKALASSGQLSASQQTAFILSDGIALLSPKAADITRDESYDNAWQAWESMESWLIEGRQYCFDLTSRPSSYIDLSTSESYLRRTLKLLDAEQKATLSKVQRREILELFRASVTLENRPRLERIASALEQVTLEREELETILKLLNSRDEVRLRVQEMIEESYASLKSEHSGLQAEIESLKHRKFQLTKEGKEIERNNRASAEKTESLVSEAFSKSIQEGVKTLANVEIFRILSGSTTLASSKKSSPSTFEPALIETRILEGSLSSTEGIARLVALGLNRRQAIILSELCRLTLNSGIAFILNGDRARQYAQVLIRIGCETSGVIDVPMGLTSGSPMRNALSEVAHVGRLGLLNADLSPLEIYGARLLDSYFDASFEDNNGLQQILLTCLGGEMSLPLPSLVRHIAIIIDLDQSWDAGTLLLTDVDFDSIHLMTSLRNRLFEQLSEIPSEYKSQVERALIKALLPKEAVGCV
ncbi:TPA: hypothetical protein SMS87_000275 [Pseudomonas aeruginosa]|nr:hypothetical protein [Pseudomonas aeruginosa]HEK2347418.1 hypothetical protein [Pseudomonas aeruginosa]